MGKYLRTTKLIVAVCKCRNTVAASLIIGGIEFDGDFTQCLAEVILAGGEIKVLDITDDVRFNDCTCQKSEIINPKSEIDHA